MTQTKAESRTPILDTYQTKFAFVPEFPDVLKFIYRAEKIIIINLAADPDANIIRLK